MGGFLSFIIGVVALFYLLSFLAKLILPWFVAKKMKDFNAQGGANFGNFNQANNQNRQKHKEGEVFVSKNVNSQKKIKDNVGDYVDFEEVK